MKVTVSSDAILSHKADCIVVGLGRRAAKLPVALVPLDKECGGVLSRLCAGKKLRAAQPAVLQLLAKGPYKALCALTVADKGGASAHQLQAALGAAAATAASSGCRRLAVHLPSLAPKLDRNEAAVTIAAQALAASAYRFELHAQSKPAPAGSAAAPQSLRSLLPRLRSGSAALLSGSPSRAAARTAARAGGAIGRGMCIARHLGEQPPNVLYPHTLAQFARQMAAATGLKAKVLDRAAAAKLKMGGLLAVGQGSVREPRLIVLEHRGGGAKDAPLALVGKGMTFDTGGNSIKPGAAMVDMKYDMCGAAGVIGAMYAVAQLELPINVVAVVPSAENMLSGEAYRPDDIITMMDGTDVEVLNTDAEGRLILADALTYVQQFYKPELIIDAATLTGACLVALGQHRSGMCCNDDELAAELFAAGEDSGDLCWRLPLDDEYDRLLASKFAAFANIGGGRNAGTITAACFLQRFVKGRPWAHLDIAGTAWQQRRASGRPVPQLVTFLARRAKLL